MTTDTDVYETLKYHRVVVDSDGSRRYYNADGQLHREDGPAVVCSSGTREWWQNGQLHREDGPAQVGSDGTKLWCINGKYHRVGGPAIEWHNGMKYWFLHGTCLTKQQYHVRLGELGLA